jgi:hydrogenase maturation protein HypF
VRVIVQIAGNVQGVGFRPLLYRLATEHGLRGTVANSSAGVDLEIEGPQRSVESFLTDIRRRSPPLATITELKHRFAEPVGHPAFVIAGSQSEGHRTALISPDVAVCDDCLN